MTVIDDPHFRSFAGSLEKAIEKLERDNFAKYGSTGSEKFLDRQKQQVEALIALEKDFKKALINHRWGEEVFAAFIDYICKTRRNILDARPYFRERQNIFTKYISDSFRNSDIKAIQKFRFNFRFVQFVLNEKPWKPGTDVARLARAIAEVRNELATMNMPLAISRAKIFFSRTPKAHLEYMDLVQIACEGLLSGIDKFVPPYSRAFRSVAIGRMTGNFIENYSETPIHFYPGDKRKIYRANKLTGRQADAIDYTKLANGVNIGVKESAHRTSASEIANLLAAASIVSSDNQPQNEDEDDRSSVLDRFAAADDCRPDVIVEEQSSLLGLESAIKSELGFLERKILVCRGISF